MGVLSPRGVDLDPNGTFFPQNLGDDTYTSYLPSDSPISSDAVV